ncbi:hypothetical protein NBRC116188_11150 [Oceaniserpentilla sp. 4NH20-0058]|uniref:Wzz/FepE/Etk N-terminal domain-containing protein n=1 Tax=Oceaniserpentilla sp. 4NH20-0058 TaxID=3127660 RepID=UPI00310835DB
MSSMNEELRVETGREDEIDLFDLWDDILQEKIWVILGFVSCVLFAVVYALTATPIYESKVVIKPASANSVVELNVPQLSGIYSKTVEEAYADARSSLLSKENRRHFYEAFISEIKSINGLYNDELTLYQNFNEFDKLFSSKVSNSKKDVEEYLQVSLELPDAEKVAQLLNAYAQFALAAKLMDVKDTLESKVRAQIDKYEYDAKQLREKYKGEQTRRNLMVSEAYTIAQAVGQDQPLFSKSEIVGTYEPPLYMFGTKALKAEEKAIKNREKLAKSLPYGEDHFINKLPELLFKIEQLKTLEINYAKVDLAVIDEQAVVPVSAIKPKKKLIVALAGVVGVFAGLMLALIMAAFKRHKEKMKTKIKAQINRA